MSVSADVELLRPALSAESAYGVEGPTVPTRGQWWLGTAVQYEHDPVVILVEESRYSEPVSERLGGWVGGSVGLGRDLALTASVPLAWQVGSDARLSADGVGLGDPRLGARWGFFGSELLDAGLRADVAVPIGSDDMWLGEEGVRGAVGLTAAVDGRVGSLIADAGFTLRSLETPQPGLSWGPTTDWALGVRVPLLQRKLGVSAAWVGRAVLAGLDENDGEIASEVVGGAEYTLSPHLRLGAGGGGGVQGGVGAPTFRGFAHLTWTIDPRPKAPPPPPMVIDAPPMPDVTKLLNEEVPFMVKPPEWQEGQLVKMKGDEIEFREEVRFAPGSDEILPESLPVIAAVADLLAEDGRIAHVAIEGHASDDGDLAYNWELSDRRARRVWEALVREGVYPERMSWRGLGEVDPVRPGAPDAERPAERRVVLRVARRLSPGEKPPELPASTLLPWSGEPSVVDVVSVPAPPPEIEGKQLPRDALDPTLFRDDEDADPLSGAPTPTPTATPTPTPEVAPEPVRPPPPVEEKVDPNAFKNDEEEE